jgi:hypothetical protein
MTEGGVKDFLLNSLFHWMTVHDCFHISNFHDFFLFFSFFCFGLGVLLVYVMCIWVNLLVFKEVQLLIKNNINIIN